MSLRFSLFAYMIGFILLCVAKSQIEDEEEVEDPDSAVITLTKETFSSVVQSHPRVLVEFYAPWCGHCKALSPKYEEAAKLLADQSPTKLAKLDATTAPELSQTFNIEGYPTLILFEGQEATPFNAGRETQDIVNWVIKHDIPAYTKWTNDQYESSKSNEYDFDNKDNDDADKEYMIFGFVKENSKREILFKSFAAELRGEKSMSFYIVNIDNKDKYRVVLRRNNRKLFADPQLDGGHEVTYTGKLKPTKKSIKHLFSFSTYDLGTWMHEHRYPFFIDLDKEPFANPDKEGFEGAAHPYSILYTVPKIPRGGVIIIRVPEDDEDAKQKMKKELSGSVSELRANEGYFTLLTSYSRDRIGFTDDVDMLLVHKSVEKKSSLPTGYEAIEGDKNTNNPGSYFTQQHEENTGKQSKETLREYRYQWRISEDGPITNSILQPFIRNRNEHGRWLRSKDNTQTSDDIYYDIITANTFHSVALDKNNDVLVLYCTQWGKYCQTFMEEYNNLAKHIAQHYANKPIKIMYLDCDENDVDDARVEQFPSMILYPAGKKFSKISDGILLSNQHRTLFDIVDFIDEHAATLNKDEL